MKSGAARVAIIPARGGSKRIPRKNVRPFHGVPLIQRTLSTLLNSGLFDQVVVSTDDDEIAELSEQSGASVPFKRPIELADDHTPTAPVVLHALDELKRGGLKLAEVAVVYPAAVFTSPQDLSAALELLHRANVDQVFSACEYEAPIQRAWRRMPDGTAEWLHPEFANTRSQDLEQMYFDAGQFYWWAEGISSRVAEAFPLRRSMYLMPRWRVQDIDTYEDWEMAEKLFGMESQT